MKTEPLEKCALFSGVDAAQLPALIQCLGARERAYAKDEYICRAGDAAVYVGVLLSGSAHVIKEDFWGNRTILTHIAPGELFAEAFSCGGAVTLPVSVVATQSASVLLVDFKKVVNSCDTDCGFHTRLVLNMLRILAGKNAQLTQKMELLSMRTTREKLLAFLSAQAVQQGGGTITLPFNRQELADFLYVERSALSRELSGMKKEGLIDYSKNRFRLLARTIEHELEL